MPPCCRERAAAEKAAPKPELADVFRAHGDSYQHRNRLPPAHLKVMHAISACRTASLGGHMQKCDHCGYEKPSYNSCKDRHCPKCQSMEKAKWLQQRKAELLPVPYFHTVFTLPHDLNPIVLRNKSVLFNLLFKALSATLQKFAEKKGGTLGLLATLHTWDQKLNSHFHLHCLVPAGLLSFDRKRWIPLRSNYLFPVKALSRKFRGKFLSLLRHTYNKGNLDLPVTTQDFSKLLNGLSHKEWIVYAKPPFAGPDTVLDYLARYIHRVAISNERILSTKNAMVSLRCRDRSNGNMPKVLSLDAHEFIRRFLLHVLPDGFVRIRYFGFLANRCRKESLLILRQLLNVSAEPKAPLPQSTRDLMLKLTGKDITLCPRCNIGTMHTIESLPISTYDNNFQPELLDTS